MLSRTSTSVVTGSRSVLASFDIQRQPGLHRQFNRSNISVSRAAPVSLTASTATWSQSPHFKAARNSNAVRGYVNMASKSPQRSTTSTVSRSTTPFTSTMMFPRYFKTDIKSLREIDWKRFLLSVKNADSNELFHFTKLGLAGLVPAAVILSPSYLNVPVDLAMGLILPIHIQYGMHAVITDYIPRPFQNISLLLLLGATGLLTLGLLKLNLCGGGITETVKSVWRKPKQVEHKPAANASKDAAKSDAKGAKPDAKKH